MTLQLQPPPFVLYLLNRLLGNGFEAFIVGGAVRDQELGRPAADWDIATSASETELAALFPTVRRFHLRHGTVTFVHGARNFEVTPFRGFPASLESDLAHRDFTLNAMAYDPATKRLRDPFQGRRDMLSGIIRAVGTPHDRFREDPLRLLRAVRLAGELGFIIEPATRAAIAALAPLIALVAAQRIQRELGRILLLPHPDRALRLLDEIGLASQLFHEMHVSEQAGPASGKRLILDGRILEALPSLRADLSLRLALLLSCMPPTDDALPPPAPESRGETSAVQAQAVMDRLGFSKAVTRRTVHLIRHHVAAAPTDWTDAHVRRYIRRVGRDAIWDVIALQQAVLEAELYEPPPGVDLDRLGARVRQVTAQPFPLQPADLAIDGRDVMALLGLPPGPLIGRLMDTLLEHVLETPGLNSPQALTRLLLQIRNRADPDRGKP